MPEKMGISGEKVIGAEKPKPLGEGIITSENFMEKLGSKFSENMGVKRENPEEMAALGMLDPTKTKKEGGL